MNLAVAESTNSLTNELTSSSSTGGNQNSNKMDVSISQQSSDSNSSQSNSVFIGDVISRLYPNVNQKETPLPRQWSGEHKFQTLSLSHSNLRVTYKGPGKTHKDAASVRTDSSIPATCGIYYFEIKIISKGRDGYMGIGLSKSDVHLNRLPGWDKNSYGYHGDDGHSFCCSGTGQNYGPTFTTGDVIGCCLNLIENTCFYTKNGFNLGIAFRDLPCDLHPTVGLQTPSESVEANFGQYPFEFDVHSYIKEWHLKTRTTIEKFPLKKETENNLPIILRKLVSTYLVHHGYSATAEAFAKGVGHVFEEELASIRHRQKILKHVLNGEIGESIELTHQLFPGILEKNPNLLFALKVRQFIEMINGTDTEMAQNNHQTSSIINSDSQQKQTLPQQQRNKSTASSSNSRNSSPSSSRHHNRTMSPSHHQNGNNNCVSNNSEIFTSNVQESTINSTDTVTEQSSLNGFSMDVDNSNSTINELNQRAGQNGNGVYRDTDCDTMMEMDGAACSSTVHNSALCLNDANLQKILRFGREIFQLSIALDLNDNANQKILKDAFSLLAYHDPWTSPVGYQLDSSQREPISAMLNSAILEANNMPRIPPLEVVHGQTAECLKLMAKNGISWCSYVN